MFTEISTINVNLRVLLNLIGLGDGALYAINGITMTLVFFVVRIILYPYVTIFKLILPQPYFWSDEFYVQNPEYAGKKALVFFCIGTYTVMGCLQFFWFNKMFRGCLKAIKKAQQAKKVDSKKD